LGGDVVEGRAWFKVISRLAMIFFLLGGFGVMPSWADKSVFEGGAPEQAYAWRRAPLLGKEKVHFGQILNSPARSLPFVWGVAAPVSVSNSNIISRRIWAHVRALVEKAATQMG